MRVLSSLYALLGLFVLSPASIEADEPSPDVTSPPRYDDFLVIPLRVHILRAPEMAQIDCVLADSDVRRVIGKANAIWHNAGVHFALFDIVREPASGLDRFRLDLSLSTAPRLSSYRVLLPQASRRFAGLHVYYIHQFSVNGVYMGADYAIVQETARLRPVEGGIDEPIPRVTAHELGHALGLPHRQNRTNLLASGTTGTLLNTSEVARARAGAKRISGMLPVSEFLREAIHATDQGDLERARRLWTWLAEIPGAEAATARDRLEKLSAP